MVAIKKALEHKRILQHWTDLWFHEDKKAGYVAITDFKRQHFYGCNDVASLVKATEGKEKQFISLNAFDVNWTERDFSRKTSGLKQIRNIGIDIDQYKLGLTIEEALDEIQALVLSNRIPEPNLVLVSRGIQIFYSLDGGASPKMAWLVQFITEQFIAKLKGIGADSNAKDMSRVMRVPSSINERNNAVVTPEIWNNVAYSLDELQSYCRPLERFNSRKKKRHAVIVPINERLSSFYKTNHARLTDLNKLIELRNGDLTGMRNVFLYIYSYHQALVLNTQKDVLHSVEKTFKNTYSKTDKPMSKREFERTVRSAYKDAEAFFQHFIDNGYRMVYKANDGIKKPYKTSNLIKKLNITEEEQKAMRSICIKKVKDKERKRIKRRAAGMKTMNEYNRQRKGQKEDKLWLLQKAIESYPKASNYKLAELLGVSEGYIRKLKKKI